MSAHGHDGPPLDILAHVQEEHGLEVTSLPDAHEAHDWAHEGGRCPDCDAPSPEHEHADWCRFAGGAR